MKKIFAIMLALVLVLAMAAPAMAATITITAPSGETGSWTYNAYKVFNVTKSGDNAYAYTIDENSVFLETVRGYATLSVSATKNADNTYNVEALAGFDAKNFAATLAQIENKGTPEKTVTVASGATGTLEVGQGYYFVDSTVGSLCLLKYTTDAITIADKNELPGVEKTVTNANEVAKIGDTVEYQITVTAKEGANKNYTIVDTMDAGLTLDVDSIKVHVGTAEGELLDATKYTLTSSTTGNDTFTVTIPATTITEDTTYVITYSATINKEAAIGSVTGNDVELKYGDDYTVKDEDVGVTLYSFDIVKTKIDNSVIDGATFKLYSDAACTQEINLVATDGGNYRVADKTETAYAENVKAGTTTISGLATGTYYLKEIAAPSGFNKIDDAIEVKIENANNTATVTSGKWDEGGVHVINNSGSSLPETGGMGTTIFYVVGGLLMAAAVVLLVTKKKVAAK